MKPLTEQEILDMELEQLALIKTAEELSGNGIKVKHHSSVEGTKGNFIFTKPDHHELIESLLARAKTLQEIITEATK